jgi:cell division protein FtsZ
VARSLGALTIGVVTRPFGFEGKRRAVQAEAGIERLRSEVDTLIVIPNDRLLSISDRHVSVLDAFKAADQVLLSGVQGITDLITTPGLINLDFADVKSVMSGAGSALMGIGSSRGDDRAVAAAEMAISSPLLEASIDGAHGVLLSIQGGSDLGLFEINEAAQLVSNSAAVDANIIFGAVIDDALGDEVRVTVIAAGFDENRMGRDHGASGMSATPMGDRAGRGVPPPRPTSGPSGPASPGASAFEAAPVGNSDRAAPAASSSGPAASQPGEQTRPWFAQDDTPAPGSVVAGSVISESGADSEPDITDAPPVVSVTEVASEAEAAPSADSSPAAGSDDETPDTGEHVADESSSSPAAEVDSGPHPAGNGSGQNGSSSDAAGRDGSAQRVFDVATTRRRAVIFEEEDDLDVPDFLK